MSDREKILSAVREALAPLPSKTPLPDWDETLPVSIQHAEDADTPARFIRKLREHSGIFLDSMEALAELLKKENTNEGYCDPFHIERFRSHPAFEGVTFHDKIDTSDIDRYGFGITWASHAIAESGSLVFTDKETSDRLGALSPWVHIALLDPANIKPTVLDSIKDFGDDPSIIWATGPSKTADVEGILIEGVHGPGIQACLFV